VNLKTLRKARLPPGDTRRRYLEGKAQLKEDRSRRYLVPLGRSKEGIRNIKELVQLTISTSWEGERQKSISL